MTLKKLYKIIKDRQAIMPQGSYTASLFKAGEDAILQKVGEEAVEVVIAAKNRRKEIVIKESADLFFHLLVMFARYGINLYEIYDELDNRYKENLPNKG